MFDILFLILFCIFPKISLNFNKNSFTPLDRKTTNFTAKLQLADGIFRHKFSLAVWQCAKFYNKKIDNEFTRHRNPVRQSRFVTSFDLKACLFWTCLSVTNCDAIIWGVAFCDRQDRVSYFAKCFPVKNSIKI